MNARHHWAEEEYDAPPPPVRRLGPRPSGSWGAPDGYYQPDYYEPDPPYTDPGPSRLRRPAPALPPPLEAQRAPQPLVVAELARVIVLLGVGVVWAVPLEDPVLDLLTGAVATVLGLAISWAATQITKGRVWALRKSVDTDRILAEAMARSRDQ